MRQQHLRTVFSLIALVSIVLMMIGCSGRSEPAKGDESDQPIRIVTTTGMITDIVERIAGEHARVDGLMQSGIDPHLYKPTRNDISTLAQGDIVFYNGLMLEGKMTDALVRVASGGAKVIAVTESIDESYLLSPPEFEGHHDPHVWMDPRAWARSCEVVAQTLIEYDPDHIEDYRRNADQIIQEINALDEYCQQSLETIPQPQRVLVTAHDAFNYFGRRFGFEVVGIQGISTESEAGVRDIERIVDLLVSREIGAVFVETTVSERNIRALIAGAKDQGHRVRIGGSLYSDAMGPEGSYEGTYIGMIDKNVTTITRALGGQAAARGMNGKLDEVPAP